MEKWSPLHAACINGHASILELLLRFPFRRDLQHAQRDKTGQWTFDAAFDLNQADVTGQTLLYMAVCVSSVKIVDMLLSFKVRTI